MNQSFNHIRLFVSIDYSLESVGVTLFDVEKKKYHFLSYLNTKKKAIADRANLLSGINDLSVIQYQRDPIATVKSRADGLFGWEQQHMNNVLYYNSRLVNHINSVILDFIPNIKKNEICVLIENYSYSSQSDTLIQLVENTMEVKHYVLTTMCHVENFYCIPAPRVKLYVGKGNYDKYDMTTAFLNNTRDDDHILNSPFYKFLLDNFTTSFLKERIKKGKQFNEVLSPISDIIDSYWILRYFLVLNELD